MESMELSVYWIMIMCVCVCTWVFHLIVCCIFPCHQSSLSKHGFSDCAKVQPAAF